MQVIDRLHDLLRQLAGRAIPSPYREAADGRLALILPRPGWDDYVAFAVDELRIYGRGSLQVARRLRYLLDDVASVTPPARRASLERERRLLDEGNAIGFDLAHDRAGASLPGRQGHGP